MEGAGGCYEIKTAIFQFTSSDPVFVPERNHSDTSSISEIFKQSVNQLNETFLPRQGMYCKVQGRAPSILHSSLVRYCLGLTKFHRTGGENEYYNLALK